MLLDSSQGKDTKSRGRSLKRPSSRQGEVTLPGLPKPSGFGGVFFCLRSPRDEVRLTLRSRNGKEPESMNVDIVASRIRGSIEATSKMLMHMPLRMDIDDLMTQKPDIEKYALARMTAAGLAVELAKVVVKNWPLEQAGFDTIREKLTPLKDISALLNSDEVNEFVRVRDTPCVMKERPRMPLEDFKKVLWKRLFIRSTDPKQAAARD